MNYYEHHLGDYAKDTAHLSMLEHGAYRLLLDRCYGTEQGIAQAQVYRVARARSREEKAAIDAVLGEFFSLQEGVWVNRRAQLEIERARVRIETARRNGLRGGRPRRLPPAGGGGDGGAGQEPGGFSAGCAGGSEGEALQSPVTNHQSHPDGCGALAHGAQVCSAMREAGLADVNPAHPRLAALLEAGLSQAELVDAARDAAGKGKSFAYALAVAQGRRRDAALVSLPPGRAWGGGVRGESVFARQARERVAEFAPGVARGAPAAVSACVEAQVRAQGMGGGDVVVFAGG